MFIEDYEVSFIKFSFPLIGGVKMKLFRNRTKLITVLLVLLVFTVILSAYGAFAFSQNRPEPATVSYTGNNGSFSVSFTRFTDYDAFLKAKSSYIISYNTKSDFQYPPGRGFIAGEVKVNGKRKLDQCDVELIRESKWSTTAIAYNMEPDKIDPINLPFIEEDFPDSAKNIYKTAIIRFDNNEIVIPLRTIN